VAGALQTQGLAELVDSMAAAARARQASTMADMAVLAGMAAGDSLRSGTRPSPLLLR
jgi:hypothetical protein